MLVPDGELVCDDVAERGEEGGQEPAHDQGRRTQYAAVRRRSFRLRRWCIRRYMVTKAEQQNY